MSIRIIGDSIFESKNADWFDVRAWDAGNGHMEVTATRGRIWVELPITPFALKQAREAHALYDADPEVIAERAAASARASARRAQKRVRQCAKAMGVSTLATLTYHANETDLAAVKRDLKEFNRRVKRVWPEFRFVAAFETQKRGAWHVHMGCPDIPRQLRHPTAGVKVKSWNLLRAIWRSVTKERGGNFDASRRKSSSRKGPAQIAAYISKYMLKDFAEGEKWSNRWTRFGQVDIPKPVHLGVANSINDAVEIVFSLASHSDIRTARLSRWGDWVYLDVEPCPT